MQSCRAYRGKQHGMGDKQKKWFLELSRAVARQLKIYRISPTSAGSTLPIREGIQSIKCVFSKLGERGDYAKKYVCQENLSLNRLKSQFYKGKSFLEAMIFKKSS